MNRFAGLVALALGLLAQCGIAAAQSSPGLVFGQVPTAGQWNSYFAAKQDYIGFTPSRTGNSSTLASFSGALTAGYCVQVDPAGSGNLIVAAAACGSGGGGGTPELPFNSVQFNNSGSFAGSANFTWVSPALTLGVSGTTTGQLKLASAGGSTVTLQASPTGTPTLTLPPTVGSSGNALVTDGTGVLTFANVSGGGVNAGLGNQLAYYVSNGSIVSGLATTAYATLVTNGSGTPSISQTLPTPVQGNISQVGTLSNGTLSGAGLTIALSAISFTGSLPFAYGGAGSPTFNSLSGCSNISIDFTSPNLNFLYSGFTGSCTINFPTVTSAQVGQRGYIQIVQSGTPGTLAFAPGYQFDTGTKPVIDSVASSTSVLEYYVRDTSHVWVTMPFYGLN